MADWWDRQGPVSVWEDKIWVCAGDELGECVTYGYDCSKKKKKRQFKYSPLGDWLERERQGLVCVRGQDMCVCVGWTRWVQSPSVA